MTFLPKDYQEPTNSDFVKLSQWLTKIRFLEKPIIWYEVREDYTDDNGETKRKVTRGRDLKSRADLPRGAKIVWTAVVWNYNDQRIQIWSITQKTIRDEILNLARDDDYGNPMNYDIKIKKEGEKMNTSYSVNPLPTSPLDQSIKDLYEQTPINMDMYFKGENPFVENEGVKTAEDDEDLPF